MNDSTEIKTIDQFLELLNNWHSSKLLGLTNIREVPLGAVVTIDDKEIPMEGEFLEGFQLGITTAMEAFKNLPYSYEPKSEN